MTTVDYATRSGTVVIANAVLMTFTGIFIIIRFWVRVFLLHQVGLDDVLIWAASIFAFILSISEILSMSFPRPVLPILHDRTITPNKTSDTTWLGPAHRRRLGFRL